MDITAILNLKRSTYSQTEEIDKMGQYKRKLVKGERWFFSGMYKGVKYHSEAKYLSKVECRKEEAERLKEIEKEIKNPRDKITLKELMDKRLDYLQAISKSNNWYRDNKSTFQKLLNAIGDIPLEKITRPMIHSYLLKESNRLATGKKDNYQVNAELKMIKALFNYAINDLEVMDINPTRKIKKYPINHKLKYIPKGCEIIRILNEANERQRELIIFALETGCRIGEALRATGEDMDLRNNIMVLWTRKKKGGNLTPRRIPLPDIRHLKREGKLFPEWTGYPKFLDKICVRLKMRTFGWHAFRHRKASLMAKEGKPLTTIQNFLGHESAVVTSKYLHSLGYNY